MDCIDPVEIETPSRCSPKSAAIGASKTGCRPTSKSISPRRNEFTQEISGIMRIICMKASSMPTTSTPMINPLSPGLVKKADAQLAIEDHGQEANNDNENYHAQEKHPWA